MEHKLEFELKPETIRFAVARFWRHHFVKKREIIFTAVFLISLLLFSLMEGKGNWLLLAVGGCYVVAVWLLRIRVRFLLLRKKMLQSIGGQTTIMLNERGIITSRGRFKSEIKWEQVKEALELPGMLLVPFGKVDFVIIPIESVSPITLGAVMKKCCKIVSDPKLTLASQEQQNRGKLLTLISVCMLFSVFAGISLLIGILIRLFSASYLNIHIKP